MGRNCLEGYLTDGCASCDDWSDGTGEKQRLDAVVLFLLGCAHILLK